MIQIKSKLLTDEKIDYLEFTFPGKKPIRVNINDSTNQNDLKVIFNEMVRAALSEEVELLDLEVETELAGTLLEDVFKDYIKDLANELRTTRDELRAFQESE